MTHKPLPAAKVKELEEYLNNLIWAFGIASVSEIKDQSTGARAAKGACEVVLTKLQSLINEAQDAQ
jgi:hypothetical protein